MNLSTDKFVVGVLQESSGLRSEFDSDSKFSSGQVSFFRLEGEKEEKEVDEEDEDEDEEVGGSEVLCEPSTLRTIFLTELQLLLFVEFSNVLNSFISSLKINAVSFTLKLYSC